MHDEARHFLDYVYSVFPDYYSNKKVLDVGGGDINGNNRLYFNNCKYIANDIIKGKNVDIVCKTSELPFLSESFDTIISSECFEHDMEYKKSLKKIVDMLKPCGLFVFTCASTGRQEHGTKRTTINDSFTTQLNNEWSDYYKNLTSSDIDEVIKCKETFMYFKFYYNRSSHDLYFFGIKKPKNYSSFFVKEA